MIRRTAFLLLMVGILLTDVAQAYYVTVNPSWIDGTPSTYKGGHVYIAVDGVSTRKDDYLYSDGDTLTFRALVQPGHEVTMWSRGAFSSANVVEARRVGHFSEIVYNATDTLVWKMPKADQSLAVHQDWLKYDIGYDGNGATGAADGLKNVIYTNKVTLAKNPFAKKGYSFAEWRMAESPDRTFPDQEAVTGESFGLSYTNKSVRLVAQWTTNEYTVTFDANGGMFNDGNTTTKVVMFDAAYGEFPTPLPRGGYDFSGSWTNSAGQTVKPTDIVKTDADHTLYARWTAKSAMRIEVIKCSDEEGANGTVTGSGSFIWGETCTLQATPSAGSHFVRWTKNAQSGTTVSTGEVYGFSVTEAATYYGHFALNRYTVTFNFCDANGNPTSTVQQVAYGQAAVEPKPPRYPENEFDVWDSYDFKTVKADLNINAKYKSTVLTVMFETQGGTPVSPNPRRWEKGEKYYPLPTTTKEGYKLKEDAWWTAENGGDKITTNSVVAKAGEQTLYARWTALQYVVTFDPNGGTITTGTGSKSVTFGEMYGTLNGVKREGYDFDGWHTPDGEKVTSGSMVGIAQDHVLTAKWNAKSWWVSLYAMGGTVDTDEIYVTYDQQYSGLEDATWPGYDFQGWYTKSTGGTQIKNGQRVKDASITSLYAHWKAKTYVVTFDSCGGSVSETSRGVEYQSQYGGQSGTLPTPVKTGYEFQGWYTEPSGGSRIYASTTYTRKDNQTLYAQWRAKTFSVVFDSNGGTAGYMSNQSFSWDVEKELSANAYGKTGYTFRGWGETADTATVRYVDRQVVSNLTESATVRLYALWATNSYTISFDGGGGLGKMESVSTKYDTPVKLPKSAFTFGVNTFKGWRGSNGQDYGDEAIVSNLTAVANGTVTLTAKWSDDYVVRFLPNGATNTVMANQNIPMLERTPLNPNEYVRSGYTYLGWATNLVTAQRHEVVYKDGASVVGLGESGTFVDLFAVWTNNLYRVRFYPNGGDGVPFERTFIYDKPQKLPGGSTFVKDGQVLKGWVTDPTNTVCMAVESSVSNLTSSANGIVSLYAKWVPGEPVSSDWAKAADSNVELTPVSETGCSIETDKGYPAGNDTCLQLKPEEGDSLVKAGVKMSVSGTGTLSLYFKEDLNDQYEKEVGEYAFFEISSDGKFSSEESVWRERPTMRGRWEGLRTFVISNVQSYVELAVSTRYNDILDYSVRLDGISWVPDKATVGVTYRTNDETVAPADIVSNATYVVGKAIGELPVLSSENFKGWSTNVTASGKIDASWIVPATDVQLYAVWDSGEHPVPGTGDAPTIGGFAPSESGFALSFVSDARFDYRLLSTLTLTPPIVWTPYGEAKQGTGEVLTFEIDAGREGTPGTAFFKVEVLQRVD